MDAQFKKVEELATEVLRLARNTILINLRFMDAALAELELVSAPLAKGMSTDGVHLVYNPVDILNAYAKEQYVVNRNYLHMLLHCLYRHNFSSKPMNNEIWNLACDITVENIINEFSISSFVAKRALNQSVFIAELNTKVKLLTAEKIYRYFLDKGISNDYAAELRKNFFADNHDLWYKNPEDSTNQRNRDSKDNEDSSQNNEVTLSCDNKQESEESEPPPQSNDNSTPSNERKSQNQSNDFDDLNSQSKDAENRWKEISERVQQELETFAKEKGDSARSLMQNLGAVNRERYDYTAFLKKFAVMGEAMKINDDEFDYVFYTYGLKLYKKMPLIEPLEYKDVKRIREFAIVIDTSCSVSGELVQTFVKKTYNILKTTESFFSKINLYIIQCDAEIQHVAKITSQDDFDEYINDLKLYGFGGTDFRPAFNYVDNLVKSGELPRLKGMIYFTDGYGTFPKKKPTYDAAFVFIDDNYNNPNVPPWAIKLVLQKNEI